MDVFNGIIWLIEFLIKLMKQLEKKRLNMFIFSPVSSSTWLNLLSVKQFETERKKKNKNYMKCKQCSQSNICLMNWLHSKLY